MFNRNYRILKALIFLKFFFWISDIYFVDVKIVVEKKIALWNFLESKKKL